MIIFPIQDKLANLWVSLIRYDGGNKIRVELKWPAHMNRSGFIYTFKWSFVIIDMHI